MPTPYAYDELTGVLDRDESVDLNRLAATVADLMYDDNGLDRDHDDDRDDEDLDRGNGKPPVLAAKKPTPASTTAKSKLQPK